MVILAHAAVAARKQKADGLQTIGCHLDVRFWKQETAHPTPIGYRLNIRRCSGKAYT